MTLTLPSPLRRAHCLRCLLPQVTCLCARAVALVHDPRVLILQHPQEVGHAKGTARLLHLSLPNSRLEVGVGFDEPRLRAWLGEGTAMLLYPVDGSASQVLAPAAAAPACLVVLDGTWRQSRRMLQANPLLQALPRCALTGEPPSRYAVRKAHRPGQLSTLEATVLALRQIGGDHPSQRALLQSFDAHMAAIAARQAVDPA